MVLSSLVPRKASHSLNMAALMLLRLDGHGDLTAHGFRRYIQGLGRRGDQLPSGRGGTGLAHTLSDKVEAAYRRGDLMDKRRRLMADWATFCGRPDGAAEVITLHARDA